MSGREAFSTPPFQVLVIPQREQRKDGAPRQQLPWDVLVLPCVSVMCECVVVHVSLGLEISPKPCTTHIPTNLTSELSPWRPGAAPALKEEGPLLHKTRGRLPGPGLFKVSEDTLEM